MLCATYILCDGGEAGWLTVRRWLHMRYRRIGWPRTGACVTAAAAAAARPNRVRGERRVQAGDWGVCRWTGCGSHWPDSRLLLSLCGRWVGIAGLPIGDISFARCGRTDGRTEEGRIGRDGLDGTGRTARDGTDCTGRNGLDGLDGWRCRLSLTSDDRGRGERNDGCGKR